MRPSPSFGELPGREQGLDDSHHCRHRHEDRGARGTFQRRRVAQGGSPRVHGSQVGGVPAQVAVVRNRTTHGGMRRSNPNPFAATALNQTSGVFCVGLDTIAEAPASQLPTHARLLKSRYRGLEMQTARVQKSNLDYGARDINARTRVLR